MGHRLIILSLALFSASALAEEFRDEKFAFTVDFPDGAKAKTFPIGDVGRAYQVGSGVQRMGLKVVDHRAPIERGLKENRAYLDQVRDQLVTRLKGAVVLDREVTLGEHLGREYTVRTTALKGHVGYALLYTERVFLVGKRFYALFTVSKTNTAREERFLNSFKITDDPGAPFRARFRSAWRAHDDGLEFYAALPIEALAQRRTIGARALNPDDEGSGLWVDEVIGAGALVYTVGTLRTQTPPDKAVLEEAELSVVNALSGEVTKRERGIVFGSVPGDIQFRLKMLSTDEGVFYALIVGATDAIDDNAAFLETFAVR